MQIIWQQDAGCLILPLRRSRLKLSFDTKPAAGVNWTGCVRQQWAVCLADYRYAKSMKVVREFWRLPETARSIVHHFPLLFLPSRHATIYTLRIIRDKFSSSLWAAIGSSVPTWHNPIGWQREWDVSFEGRPRLKAGSQIIDCVFLFWGLMLIWNMIQIQKSFPVIFYIKLCIRFSIKCGALF